jgi:hypothetical protein
MNFFDWFKIGSSYVLGTAAFAACLYFAWTGSSPVLEVLLCLGGGALGWVVGILITPLDAGETKQFSDFTKAVGAIISGYVIGKLDTWLQVAGLAAAGNYDLFITRGLLFVTCFLLTTLFTFVGRRYLRGPEHARQLKREQTIAELRDVVAKLSALN